MKKELILLMGIITIASTSIIFKKIKKTINVNEVDNNEIFLSNEAPCVEHKSYKYYIGYLGGTGFRPLHIIVKKIKLYTNYMNTNHMKNY